MVSQNQCSLTAMMNYYFLYFSGSGDSNERADPRDEPKLHRVQIPTDQSTPLDKGMFPLFGNNDAGYQLPTHQFKLLEFVCVEFSSPLSGYSFGYHSFILVTVILNLPSSLKKHRGVAQPVNTSLSESYCIAT